MYLKHHLIKQIYGAILGGNCEENYYLKYIFIHYDYWAPLKHTSSTLNTLRIWKRATQNCNEEHFKTNDNSSKQLFSNYKFKISQFN